MTATLVVGKSLRQHALSTVITALSIALAGALLMGVWTLKEQAQAAFTGANSGFDAVLGARGSKLQLILYSIFHLDESPGNIRWEDYLEIRDNPQVETAVPIAAGDNYRGHRLVGVTTNLFHGLRVAPGKTLELAKGRLFDPARREALLGSYVAQRLGLRVGETFHPFHGLLFDEEEEHSETYLVVGILRPSNTPIDRVIWIPLAGLQKMSGHDPKASNDLSAVLVKLKGGSALAGQRLSLAYNKEGTKLTFAWPIGQIVASLFNKIVWFDRVLALVAGLVALVAAGSVLASIYNTLNERRREVAILRALGARRRFVFASIVLEAAAIAVIGMLFAFVFYFIMFGAAAQIIRAQTGVVLDLTAFHWVMLWGPASLIALSALAGAVPAWKAYQTDVAENLAPKH